MTTFTSMPGHWPESRVESREVIYPRIDTQSKDQLHLQVPGIDKSTLSYPWLETPTVHVHKSGRGPKDYSYPRINTQVDATMLQLPPTNSPASSRSNSEDELFFECRTPSPNTESERDQEESMPSYLVFEPVVDSVTREPLMDWRRYDPPKELTHLSEDTSDEIRGIIEPSIDRIKARYAMEEQGRAAQARRERTIARVGRASVRPPKREPMMSGALDVSSPEGGSSSRLSAGSAISMASNDSGYATTSPSLSPGSRHLNPATPSKGKSRSFGFSSIFGRSNKSVVSFEGLGDKSSRPTTSAGDDEPLRTIVTPAATVSPPVTVTTITECVSCLDDFDSSGMITLSCHSYCAACFTLLITNALESETHWPAKCCLNPIPSTTVLPHISSALKTKYHEREAEWSIPADSRIYCSSATCSAWIAPKHITTTTHTAKCPSCATRTCTTCRGASHSSNDCPSDPSLVATINLAEQEGWKRCYACQALVEHNQGCRHMTCRCKAQFCYICTAKWRTCSCTDAQLQEIQETARTRRNAVAAETARQARERVAREAAEEEDRIILQLVADFEAVERERERVAEEARRAAEEAERLAREEAARIEEERRLAAVSARFRLLGSEMEALHNIQRVLLSERYEFESLRLQSAVEDELAILAIRHPAEISSLSQSSKSKIEAAEQAFISEYHTRLAEERRIEEQYALELTTYWSAQGVFDAEFRIRDARDELRRSQASEYKFWDGYRRMQLQSLREAEKRKLEMLGVKQKAEVRAVEGRAQIDRVLWERTKVAEGRWVEAVVEERGVMLGDEERAQYAGDAEVQV